MKLLIAAILVLSAVVILEAMPPRGQNRGSGAHVDVQPEAEYGDDGDDDHDDDDHHDDHDDGHDDDMEAEHVDHRPEGHGGEHTHGHEHGHNMDQMSAPISAEEEHAVADASHHFAGELYSHLRMTKDDSENIFVSPFSIQAALSMAMLGAQGHTRDEIRDGLHLHSLGPYRVHTALSDILKHLDSQEGYTLNVANGAFVSSDYINLCETYAQHLLDLYSAELTSVDFTASEDAKATLNSWVADATENMIPEMFESVDADLVLVLLNALYFKGDWATEFDIENTATQTFHLNEDENIEVEMMFRNGDFNYYYDADIDTDVVEVPYKGNVSLYLAVPREVDGIRAMENTISHHVVHNWHNNFVEAEIDLYLPKFQIEDDTDLKDILEMLGMSTMFTNDADFSHISEEMNMKVSEVKHKAVIKVNEEGSEAAAATEVGMVFYSVWNPTTEVKADRPFVIYVVDNTLDIVLFMGRVQRPESLDE